MSVTNKFTLWLVALMMVLAAIATAWFVSIESHNVKMQARESAAEKTRQSIGMLSVIDAIMAERVKNSMNVLKKRGLQLGTPAKGEPTQVAGRDVPQLLLGEQEQSNRYELVDGLTADMGGTATLFVQDGADYVRVSTNVQKEGKRATGTTLNPAGAAYKAIASNRAFYGQVDILGSPYLTGYEPMKNAAGQTIGVWYVGYSADLTELGRKIADTRILQKGFIAIVDDQGRVRMHSDNYSSEQINNILNSPDSWQITRTAFEPWNYSVVAAYSNAEISSISGLAPAKSSALLSQQACC